MTVKPDRKFLLFLYFFNTLLFVLLFLSKIVFIVSIPVLQIATPIIAILIFAFFYYWIIINFIFTNYSFFENFVIINKGLIFRRRIYFYMNKNSGIRYIKVPFGTITQLFNSGATVFILTEYKMTKN